jgi:hypothetical protein
MSTTARKSISKSAKNVPSVRKTKVNPVTSYKPQLIGMTCNAMEDLSKQKHFSRDLRFIVKMKTSGPNFYNINDGNDGTLGKAINAINTFIDNDKDTAQTSPNKRRYMYLLHNIQNKATENGLGNVFKSYENTFFPKQFDFTKSMIMIFQEANFDSLDLTIYGKGDFYYTNCDIAKGNLFIDRSTYTIYGNNAVRSAAKRGNRYIYKNIKPSEDEINENNPNYYKCFTRDNGYYSCYEKRSYSMNGGVKSNISEIVDKFSQKTKYNVLETLENQTNDQTIEERMAFYKQVYTTSLVEERFFLIFDKLREIISEIYKQTNYDKTNYNYTKVMDELEFNKKDNPGHYKPNNPLIANYLNALAQEENHVLLKKKFPEVFKFLDDVVKKVQKIETKSEFQHLLLQYNTFLNPLIYLIYEIDDFNNTSNNTQYPNVTEQIHELFQEHLITSVFNHPQFRMTEFNYDTNVFKGKIMVHDITEYIVEGLAITDPTKLLKKVTQKEKKQLKVKGGNPQSWRNDWRTDNRKLFAISCDERMNLDKDEKNTKQLCTIFSSDYFDPRISRKETHVLLIGLGVTGPSLNHVALVIANNDFTDVTINVHLESGGQGAKKDKIGHQYAIAELDALLQSVVGNEVHPFFERHKDKIQNIRIFGDFNLTSNAIAKHLMGFKIDKKYKMYKMKLLLDRIKTHDNVNVTIDKNTNTVKTSMPITKNGNNSNDNEERQGCIDNVIYITKQKTNKLNGVFIGNRKVPGKAYNVDKYKHLSDHSPVVIIEEETSDSFNYVSSLESLNSFKIESPASLFLQPQSPDKLKRNRSTSYNSLRSDSKMQKRHSRNQA